jgi:hypothetical protein
MAAAVFVVVVASMACSAQNRTRAPEPVVTADGQPLTAEAVIRQHDINRVWSLDEYASAKELDADMQYLEAAGSPEFEEAIAPTSRWEHVGRATWSVLTVVVTLGMAALPFLI